MRKLLLKTPLATGLALFALGLCVAGAPARADTVAVNWYAVTPGIPDFTGNECCGVYANEVLPTLGPDGLPVVLQKTTPTRFWTSMGTGNFSGGRREPASPTPERAR